MSDTPVIPARRVPCPTCKQSALYSSENPWRPFCSQRCRGADLGAWANEQFRVPAETRPDEGSSESGH